MNFIESLIYSKGKKIFMRKGIYCVYVETPYIYLPCDEHIYLIETGESYHYVREYLTKKKIPVCYGKHYIYKDIIGHREDTYEYKSNLIGAYKYPYYIKYNQAIIEKEFGLDERVVFGVWLPPTTYIEREYDYDFPHCEANAKDIEEYCKKHANIEAFSSQLDTIFSNSIDKYLEQEWPHKYIYRPDIYWYQREEAKKKMLKKL